MAWPRSLGLGSYKVIENGAFRQTMYDFLLVCHCDYSSILHRLCVIWRWLISWPRNLGQRSLKVIKLVPLESLGAVFYLPSIVTIAVSVAVCEIFSVKEWCDLKSRVRVRSRSKNYEDNVKPFSSDTGTLRIDGWTDRQTDGRTDGSTERIAMSISRVSVLTRDKNQVDLPCRFEFWPQST